MLLETRDTGRSCGTSMFYGTSLVALGIQVFHPDSADSSKFCHQFLRRSEVDLPQVPAAVGPEVCVVLPRSGKEDSYIRVLRAEQRNRHSLKFRAEWAER